MNPVKFFIGALGRMCVSAIFILSSVSKIMNWTQMQQTLTNAFHDLLIYIQGVEWMQDLVSQGLLWTKELLVCATIVELLGGLLVFFGLKVRFGAFLLLLFLIPTTIVFHHFWFLQGSDRDLQITMFLKNLSIFGGLLVILALGTGKERKRSAALSK